MAKEAKHPVKATEKSMVVIEALFDLETARIRDLESRLDLSKSAIHNHLSTLREHEYVVKDGNEYRLGLKFLNLGGHTRNKLPLFRVGKPKVDRLAQNTGELVNLITEEYGKGVYLYQSQGESAVHLDTHVGTDLHLHYIGAGKAILAHLPERRVDEIVDRHGLPAATENTITDRETLLEELERIRDRGYAIDNEERDKGLQCIAAPVLDPEGEVLGAVSISTAASRFEGEFDEESKEQVQTVAHMIELELKYYDEP